MSNYVFTASIGYQKRDSNKCKRSAINDLHAKYRDAECSRTKQNKTAFHFVKTCSNSDHLQQTKQGHTGV